MVNRFAVLLAAALGIASALFLFLPSSANGQNCGTWISPNFGKSEAQAVYDGTAGAPGELADERAGVKSAAVSTYRACDDKLDSRRLWTILAFGAALAAAPAVLLVAGLDDERQTATL